MSAVERQLLAHVIYRLDIGGLENGLVNLINRLDKKRYRHAIICLLDSTQFQHRIEQEGVEVVSLAKRPGKDPAAYIRLWRVLRRLRPALVHTRNLPTVDLAAVAAIAGVPVRVHGEHGRDVIDLDGMNPKYRAIRRLMRMFVTHYVALSHDLANWLHESIGVPQNRIEQIYNGVDSERFKPPASRAKARRVLPFDAEGGFIVGSVGRLVPVKDYGTLVDAFAALCNSLATQAPEPRLVFVGSGPEQQHIEARAAAAGVADRVWLAGACDDVPGFLHAFDVFVLPSLGEGISNTILEAMACGLPVIASRVGGNPELVMDGRTGMLFDAGDADTLAAALTGYATDAEKRQLHGQRGRQRIEESFTIDRMVAAYDNLYQRLLAPVVQPASN